MADRSIDPRSDAHRKAAARARYTQDLYPPRMLHGVVVRSHAPAARVRVDVSAAAGMAGVVAALGPDQVPDRRFGIVEQDEPVLAKGQVRYIGEPLALVAGETRAQALAGADAIEVSYDPLPATVRLDDAMIDGATEVASGESNVGEPSHYRRGEVDEAFRSAAHVVTTCVRSHRVHQGYIELRAALAEIDVEGRLVVTMTSQAPFQVRQTLAHVFGLPMTDVVVRVPAFGGGFGGKLHNGMAPYAAALALATERPVQVISTREEEMQAANPRENSIVELSSALDEEGKILGRRATLHFDSGAYTYDTPYITAMGALQGGGPYACEAIETSAYAVRTNTQPTGSFRAPSGPQMCFANETHMDEIAAELGIDGLELRRRNLMRPGDLGPTGQAIESPAASACLERGDEVLQRWRADSEPPEPPILRGHGLAMAWWFTAPGPSGASVRVEEDGTLTVSCGATEIGTGAVVSGLTSLVAGELGVDPERIRLTTASTDSAPQDFGSEGSRTLYGAGNAVLRAAGEVRAILAEQAADELEASPDDIVFAGGNVHVAGSPDVSISLADLRNQTALASGTVVGSGRFQPPPTQHIESCTAGMLIPAFNEPTFHCHVAEVEVDPELGKIRVVRYAAIHDTGPIVSWSGVKGQIEGGVLQGLGYALFEEMLADDSGLTINSSLVDYRLPTIADVPDELLVLPIEDFPSAVGPRGAKGIGEAPVIPAAAAIAAAVRDATGVRFTELPLTAPRVSAALHGEVRA